MPSMEKSFLDIQVMNELSSALYNSSLDLTKSLIEEVKNFKDISAIISSNIDCFDDDVRDELIEKLSTAAALNKITSMYAKVHDAAVRVCEAKKDEISSEHEE